MTLQEIRWDVLGSVVGVKTMRNGWVLVAAIGATLRTDTCADADADADADAALGAPCDEAAHTKPDQTKVAADTAINELLRM